MKAWKGSSADADAAVKAWNGSSAMLKDSMKMEVTSCAKESAILAASSPSCVSEAESPLKNENWGEKGGEVNGGGEGVMELGFFFFGNVLL